MLDKEILTSLKAKLEAKEKELEQLVKEMEKTPEFGSDVDSYEEEADEAEEFSANLGKAKLFHERLHDVKKALQKMEKGEYGKCEKCEGEIELEVLNIDPESRLCKKCKLEQHG